MISKAHTRTRSAREINVPYARGMHHGSKLRTLAIVLVAFGLGFGATGARGDSLARAIETLAESLDERAVATLGRMRTDELRLLALRSYLRAGAGLAQRWSWTDAEIERYVASPEYAAALAEIDKVARVFAQRYPGYRLYVNPEVRSLDTQIERWNDSPGVAAVATALTRAVRGAGVGTARELRAFLVQWRPPVAAPLAAPGLSAHGQLRAFDFQIMSGDRLVAGPSVASVRKDWDGAGWTERLRSVVEQASDKLEGPLMSPREPWHYTYSP